MTTYRYELGIDWTAVEQEQSNFQLQVGLVEVNGGGETVASPFALLAGDHVEFCVVDITGEQGATTRIDNVVLVFEPAVIGQQNLSPFASSELTASGVTSSQEQQSAYYNGSFDIFACGLDQVAVHEGRFMLKAQVEATSSLQGAGTATWKVDPEMAVGAGNEGG